MNEDKKLWINNDGEVACERHKGHKHGWVRVTKEEMAGFTGLLGCEYCEEEVAENDAELNAASL